MSELVSGKILAAWRDRARRAAIAAKIPATEVDWLLREVSDLNSLELRLETFRDRSEIQLARSLSHLTQLWSHRLSKRTPVQYLVGTTPWRHFHLKVNSSVLIPRPETEYIIDLALKAIGNSRATDDLARGNWADLGTGSGAIALGLAEVLTNSQIHAVDKSGEALAVARENAALLGFRDRIQFYQGDWWSPLQHLRGQLSGTISNPPYIPTEAISQLQVEIAQHEPHLALDGGRDGLDCIRHLVTTAPDYLRSGGIWLVEMMAGQGQAIADLLAATDKYDCIEIINDFSGRDRFILAYRR